MSSIKDLEGVYSPTQKARISRKLSQRAADLLETRVKTTPLKGVVDDFDRQLLGRSPFKFKASRGSQSVEGIGAYSKPQNNFKGNIEIEGVVSTPHAEAARRKGDSGAFEEVHKVAKNKAMDPKFVKEAAVALSKPYPKADIVHGHRVTGMRSRSNPFQSIDLKKAKAVAERAGRIGRRSAGKLSVLGTLADYKDFQSQMRAAKKIRDDYKNKGLLPGGST